MESVIRASIVYIILFIILRLSGKRTLSDATPFDLVLLLIISETVQEALVDEDYSITNSVLLVLTLILIDLGLSIVKQTFKPVAKFIEGSPMIVVERGKPLKERMDKARISEDDILEAARQLQGLERMDQIKYAVLETNGTISIIPME
jgi:uncharacterized membrane protein YcaP (DUF421 family)